MTPTRVGKIARLPAWVRTQLNERLHNGEPGPALVAWLNKVPAVQEVLAKSFGGRPVTVQNLSEWRKGGFADWLRDEPTRRWVETLMTSDETLVEMTGGRTLADRVSNQMVIALGQSLQQLMKSGDLAEPAHLEALRGISRELARLRHGDSQENWWKLEKSKFEDEMAERHRAEIEELQRKLEWKAHLGACLVSFRAKEEARTATERSSGGNARATEEAVGFNSVSGGETKGRETARRVLSGRAAGVIGENPTKSRQIRRGSEVHVRNEPVWDVHSVS